MSASPVVKGVKFILFPKNLIKFPLLYTSFIIIMCIFVCLNIKKILRNIYYYILFLHLIYTHTSIFQIICNFIFKIYCNNIQRFLCCCIIFLFTILFKSIFTFTIFEQQLRFFFSVAIIQSKNINTANEEK